MENESKSKFEHVGERLRRYQSSGAYFAWVRHKGKLFRKSLETTDKITAKRLLREFVAKLDKLDVGAGNVTLTELCDRYLATIQNQQSSTVEWKSGVVKRLKEDWADGPYVRVSEIRASQVKSWLASYKFSYASYNHHLSVIRAIFQIAVDDHILVESPVATLKAQKPGKPIRQTPSWEQFKQIVVDVRSQRFNREAEDSADYVEFLGLAGIGNAEANNLTWGDVSWDRDRIRLHRKKTDVGFEIPIYPQLRTLLERLRGNGDHAQGERILKINNAKKALIAACVRLNFPRYGHRALRRMFITRALQKGVDVKTISSWQAHQDGGKLILSTYSHVLQPHADSMALKLVDE